MIINSINIEKENFNEFKTVLSICFDVTKESIIKQENIVCEKDNILITLLKLPNEYLNKKELKYNEGIIEETIKSYYIIVFRVVNIENYKQPIQKLDYGNYDETIENALNSFEKIKEAIIKDINR